MHALALTRRMTDQAPQARSGDEPVERRAGYVTFDVLLTALEQANRPQTEALNRLERAFTRELRAQTEKLSTRLDDHEEDSHRREQRIAALEAWRQQEEVDEAFRQGFWHVLMLAFRWLVEHWPAMVALGMTIVGIVWVLISGGRPGIEITP